MKPYFIWLSLTAAETVIVQLCTHSSELCGTGIHQLLRKMCLIKQRLVRTCDDRKIQSKGMSIRHLVLAYRCAHQWRYQRFSNRKFNYCCCISSCCMQQSSILNKRIWLADGYYCCIQFPRKSNRLLFLIFSVIRYPLGKQRRTKLPLFPTRTSQLKICLTSGAEAAAFHN